MPHAQTFTTAAGDRYHILREIGGGGMSRMYLAEESALGRRVALKVLPTEWGLDVSAERFQREIYLAASLSHPHIVPLLTAGATADGQLFYTMPFVEGESLRERIAREGELPVADALRALRNVADALTYAHARGVVHCDIKPGNILLAGQHALVTDFGIARALTGAGQAGDAAAPPMGTPAYMAPEQVAPGAIVDHRADIYALGAVAYEMLTGRPPYAGVSPMVVLAAHVVDVPDPIDGVRHSVPPALAQLVHDCLEKRPADRPQSAEQVLRALDALAVRASGETNAGWVSAAAPDRLSDGTTARTVRALERRKRSRRRAAAGAVSGLALVAAGALAARGGGFGPVLAASLGGTPTAAAPAAPEAPPASVAVLPFVNLSPVKENEYFSDGVTEEITNALAQVSGLHVASRTSAFAFKGRDADVRAIGRKLGVSTVLEGSVRRDGNRVRITAQLVNTADGYQVWSHGYEGNARDVFALQDQIARAISGRLAGGLAEDRDATAPLVRPPTGDVDAYDLYLRGRYSWNERTESGIRKAIAYLEQATRKDPQYANAFAALADAYVILPDYSDVPTGDAYKKAKAAAERALALDRNIASAYATLAVVQTYADWDWAGADTSFRRAIALKPGYATAHQWYANYLMTVGKLDSAIAEERKAAALDPQSRVINTQIGQALYLARRYAEAETALRKAVAVDPTFTYARNVLAQVLAQQGRYAEARREVEQCLEIDGRQSLHLMTLGYVAGLEGKRDEATRVIDELKDRATHQYVGPSIIATVYAAMGDRDDGFHWLERALADRESFITYLQFDPVFDSLRRDARYEGLLVGMKLK